MDEPANTLRASDLPIALYQNQRVTFDLLASLEGGFAHVTTVQASSSHSDNSMIEGGAGLGISNPFALINFGFGATAQRDRTRQSSGTTTEERVHTPTSLFARLRKELLERKMVTTIEGSASTFDQLKPNEFVEFQAVLRRSPLVDFLQGVRQLAPMMEALAETGNLPNNAPRRRANAKTKQPKQSAILVKQVDTLLEAVTAAGSEDFIAECGNRRLVLTAESTYFVDSTMNDVIDGTFGVFGKVTRVVPEGAEAGINLLRKSPLGSFPGIAERFNPVFESLADTGLTAKRMETEIALPTLQVIPIAIFA